MDPLIITRAMHLALEAAEQLETPKPDQEVGKGADGIVQSGGRRYRVAVRVVVEDVGPAVR